MSIYRMQARTGPHPPSTTQAPSVPPSNPRAARGPFARAVGAAEHELHQFDFGCHSRASLSASEISCGVIFSATRSRSLAAALRSLMSDAGKCEAERQHAKGEAPCDFAPESRPGHFRVAAHCHLHVSDTRLQFFDLLTSAKSQSRQKRHGDPRYVFLSRSGWRAVASPLRAGDP